MAVIYPRIANLDMQEFRRYAGLAQSDWRQEDLQDAVSEVLIHSEIKGSYLLYDYIGGAVGDYTPDSKALMRHLCGASKIVALAVTLGVKIELRVDELLAAGELIRGYLLNAAATALIEQAADYVCAFCQKEFGARGMLSIGQRFSPGYADWELTEQRLVLPMTGGEQIGITLNEACSLQPKKSITAFVPLGQPRQQGQVKGCLACSKLDCTYRKGNNM